MDAVDVLSWVGAALSSMLALPQARRMLGGSRGSVAAAGVAATTYWLMAVNAVVWFAWALATGSLAVAVPSLLNGPVAAVVLWQLHRADHATGGPSAATPGRATGAASPAGAA